MLAMPTALFTIRQSAQRTALLAMKDTDPTHRVVQTNLTTGSVFAGIFEMALRSRLLRMVTLTLLVLGVIACTLRLLNGAPPTLESAFIAVLQLTLFAMLPVLFAFFVSAFTAVLSAAQPGVLGEHRFETRDEGLFEATTANQTVTNWSCVRGLATLADKIIIRLTGLRYHIIPKSAFLSPQHERDFVSALSQQLAQRGMN